MPPFDRCRIGTIVAFSTALLCLACVGCQADDRPPGWGPDVGSPDTFDLADGGMEDTFEPSFGSDAYVFPGAPPEGTHCNDSDWCWIHPAPFPHRIAELKHRGQRVLGVAEARELRGYRPFIWNESGVELLDVWFKENTDLSDMTIGGDEWLTVEHGGEVAAYSTDGSKEALYSLPGTDYRYISGNSPSELLAVRDFDGGAVVRDGQVTEADNFPGIELTLKMFPNGEVWGVQEPRDPDDLDAPPDWNTLSNSSNDSGGYILGLGPGPESPCAEAGWWAYQFTQSTIHWSPGSDSGTPVETGAGIITHFTCDTDGNLVGLSRDGALVRRTDDGWEREQVANHALYTMATDGETAWIGGNHGTLLRQDAQGIERLHRGYRPPSDLNVRDLPAGDYGSRELPVFTDLWINEAETKVHLVYQEGAALGTEGSGWERQEVAARPDGAWGFTEDTEVIGQQSPAFAMGFPGLLRWVDGEWEFVDFGSLQEIAENANEIAGSPDDLWVLTKDNLLHFDGSEWTNTTHDSSDAAAFLAQDDVVVSRLAVTEDGQVFILGLNSNVYRAVGEPDDLDIELAFEAPCSSVRSIHRAEDNSIYVGGDSLCVARYDDGNWTEIEKPPTEGLPGGYRKNLTHLVQQPGNRPLLAIGRSGIFAVGDDGKLRTEFVGMSIDAEYLEQRNALWVLTQNGIVAKYYE